MPVDKQGAKQIISLVCNMDQHQIKTTIYYLYESLTEQNKKELKNNFRFKEAD